MMRRCNSRALAVIQHASAREQHAIPKPAPSFASRHPYEAVVNGISYGYFSNATAAADTARYWANKLAREQSLQCHLPPRET